MQNKTNSWHHSPSHVFQPNTMYMLTGGTFQKGHFFKGEERLAFLEREIFEVFDAYCWRIEAWAVLSNHYHVIAHSPEDPKTLKTMMQRLHSQTARKINRLDNISGRKVWFQFWDTCITYEKSYYPRLRYVNENAVHHGICPVAENYKHCSAAWFFQNADPAYRKKVESFKYDNLNIEDDF